MSRWEENLPPIMKERLSKISDATPEEKERMKALDQLKSILANFYKGHLDPEGLWSTMKKLRDGGKGNLLKEAQLKLIDTLNLAISDIELQERRDAILGIESLKDTQNTTMIESDIKEIQDLRKKYKMELEQTLASLKDKVKKNPRLRMKAIRQGTKEVIVELNVDEATKLLPEWNDFLSDHEKRYSQQIARIMEKLKAEI